MPIHEFECRACGHRFAELFRTFQSAEAASTPTCTMCKSADTYRVVSAFAIHGSSSSAATGDTTSDQVATQNSGVTPKEQISAWRSAKTKES